jgi:hypothetical protein
MLAHRLGGFLAFASIERNKNAFHFFRRLALGRSRLRRRQRTTDLTLGARSVL